ncbi:hypothetical protein ACE1TH_09925 [Shouchella sp. JSM 1781072]|uniref:YxiG family protein n=1 Tax=Bacillaceae TaxID=186817 RepID=UPI000C069D2A|nr:hypothetical protein [Bacillus sp. Marseille-P3800]
MKELQGWIDYFEEGSNIIDFNLNPFCKELKLVFRRFEDENSYSDHEVLFKQIGALYYNSGYWERRFEEIDQKNYIWFVVEIAYQKGGFKDISLAIDDFNSSANFYIQFSEMLLAIEAQKVVIDEVEYYA